MIVEPSILTYAALTPEQKVFMFNFIVEEAAKVVFEASELTAYTSFVSPKFQKQRPRCEHVFVLGPGQLRWAPRASLPAALATEKIESAYKGMLEVSAITAADQLIHSAFCTKVRALMMNFKSRVNNVSPMVQHKVQLITAAGESPTYESETGVYQTKLQFNLDLSIQATAWELLA